MAATDSTEFVVAIHNILTIGADLVELLNRDVRPETQETVSAVTTVVETQARLIRMLTESQLELTDKIDDIVARYSD